MGDTADRLTLPKRQDRVESACVQVQLESQTNAHKITKATEGIPPHPLPTWVTLPLDAKLPMLPGPKGAVVLHTTNMGEKIHKSSSELDFDLTDPYSILMSNCYKPLHDPHLRTHLTATSIRRRLYNGGFITHDGKVICNLKEFNDYRKYLRKINLALERKKEQEQVTEGSASRVKKPSSTANIARAREEKVKEIKERLAQQHEADKQRYLKLKAEDEERRKRLKEEQLSRISEKERMMRDKEDQRQISLSRKQYDEKRRKMALLRNWMKEDQKKKILAETRRREKEESRQRKLEESWELRKKAQQEKIDEDLRRQESEQNRRLKRIEERDHHIQQKQQRHQDMFVQMSEKRRAERERMEENYLKKFAAKIERRRAESAQRRKKKRKGKKAGASKYRLQSNWTIEKSILQAISVDDRDLGKSVSDGQLNAEDKKRKSFMKLMNASSSHEIGLSVFFTLRRLRQFYKFNRTPLLFYKQQGKPPN